MNLFVNTQKLTSAKEDHLTEFFAAALESSETMRADFIRFILGKDEKRRITKIETQAVYDGCRPDMRFTLSDGSILLCENKLDAAETEMCIDEERYLQLERYLCLPIDGLIYIRTQIKAPAEEILEHDKYIKPDGGKPHFLWRDFYPMLMDNIEPLVQILKAGFESMGFVPPHPSIGDLSRDAPRAQRENFSKFWTPTVVAASNLGWKVQTGDIVERYFYHSTARLAGEAYVTPVNPKRFLIRLTPVSGQLNVLLDAVKSVPKALNQIISTNTVRRVNGFVDVVDIETPINHVFPEVLSTSEEIESALMKYVSPYLKVSMDITN